MSEILWFAVAVALLAATVLLHAHALYSVALPIVSIFVPRRRPTPDAQPNIAVLVVAHDEEEVIADCARSLVNQDYPREHFEVFVIADNCSDQTAARARDVGARTLERASGGARGKSAALAYGVDEVSRDGTFDAIAVFDADNVADSNFLAAVGSRLSAGERIVQGFVDAKNPEASWVAASSALGFWSIAGVVQGPRERLGLSAPLMGTAWAATVDVCKTVLHGAESLTDDLEFGAKLAIEGTRVAFEPRAFAVDEKPTRIGDAYAQRQRWMQGRWQVVSAYLGALLRRAMGSAPSGKPSSLGVRFRALDIAAQLVTPSLLFTAVALAVVSGVRLGLEGWMPASVRSVTAAVPAAESLIAAAVYYAIPVGPIAAYSRGVRVWLFYAVQPLYLVLSIPLAVTGFLLRRGTVWRRTQHGESSN